MDVSSNIPAHVAIIMDGNGRWAQQRGQERVFGHARGSESVRDAVRAALRNGVRYLTLYAFSTENWGRPADEVDALMELLCSTIVRETPELVSQGVRVRMIGEREGLSDKVLGHIGRIEEQTAHCDKLTLVLAVNYSSRWETVRMARRIAGAAANGELAVEGINYATVEANLSTAGIPDPDFLIRTSGECRLSNFLLLQLAYAELYFTDTMWPDFGEAEFDRAIAEYQRRNRRYGVLK